MTIRLLEHFDRLIDTPDAVPRLRRFILDLAVRGKLVEQDPKDEPAERLLERIEKQRRRLVKDGKIKDPKGLPAVEQAERPYDIPIGWLWTRLGATVNSHAGGGTPSKNNSAYWDGDIHWASVKDIGKTKYVDDTIDRITEAGLANSSSNLIPPGNLIVVTRMGLGKISINRISVAINQDLRALSLSKLADIDFYYIFFKTASYEGSGLTVKGIKVEELLNFPFPLPPLAEQHRIVAKVDELMALCDELEAAQTKREKRRDRLVAATLHGLNRDVVGRDGSPSRPNNPHPNDGGALGESALPGAFEESARFYFNHLPRLTTRPEHIHQLRQTILNLAVRGKLVPQDINDEPVIALRKHYLAQRERLLSSGEIRRRNPLPRIEVTDFPFTLPGGWAWIRMDELVLDADSGWSPKCEDFCRAGDSWGVVKVSAVSWDQFLPDENKQLLSGVLPRDGVRIRQGDFLISRANTSELVAKCVVVKQEPVNLMLSDKIVRLRLVDRLNKVFLSLVNNHLDYARAHYSSRASGTSLSMKNVSRDVIYSLPVPLPPIAEQDRIVARVGELMTLCEQVEAELASTAAANGQLLEATVADALQRKPAMATKTRHPTGSALV